MFVWGMRSAAHGSEGSLVVLLCLLELAFSIGAIVELSGSCRNWVKVDEAGASKRELSPRWRVLFSFLSFEQNLASRGRPQTSTARV